jgi:hypothetical protein
MERSARFLFPAGLTIMVWLGASGIAAAADGEASAQVLVQLDIPDQVTTAHWSRLTDAYVLKVVIDRPATPARSESATADQPAVSTTAQMERSDRSSFFIGNTIANLRGMDPAFGCRTLTLIDGRRAVGAPQPTAAAPPPRPAPAPSPQSMNQPYPPKVKDPRIEVWLLKADGTQILPATYSCDLTRRDPDKSRPHAEVSYEFPLAITDQAVAAAIRIEDRYFIQKLQPAAERVTR